MSPKMNRRKGSQGSRLPQTILGIVATAILTGCAMGGGTRGSGLPGGDGSYAAGIANSDSASAGTARTESESAHAASSTRAPSAVEVRVLDPQQHGVPRLRMTFSFTSRSGETIMREIQTDSAGHARLTNLPQTVVSCHVLAASAGAGLKWTWNGEPSVTFVFDGQHLRLR